MPVCQARACACLCYAGHIDVLQADVEGIGCVGGYELVQDTVSRGIHSDLHATLSVSRCAVIQAGHADGVQLLCSSSMARQADVVTKGLMDSHS